MGGRLSRREVVPNAVGARDSPYRYPPPEGGNYFSSHYQLGHRKYENGDPEYFLFGETSDINFLSSKPVAFPYKQPSKGSPLSCLQCHINIHRDSVRLVKSTEQEDDYHVVFEFNSNVDCRLSLLSGLPDSSELAGLRNGAGSGVKSSRHCTFSRGSEQSFNSRDFPLTPSSMREEELSYNPEEGQDEFPLAIFMETTGTTEYQCQLTLCVIDKASDGGYNAKVVRQKLWVDGVEYVLQEIYGLENKSKHRGGGGGETREEGEEGGSDGETTQAEGEEESEDDEEDLGAECVICITDVRDTVLLPCRHLCLCASCAGNLRYQSNNCPICRTPFKALLQVTALKPIDPTLELDEDSITGNPRYAIPGFETLTLLEALNGYKLKLNNEEEEEEEVVVTTEGTAQRPEHNSGDGVPTSPTNAPDTVISVEEDPDIEALSQHPVAPPTGHAYPVVPAPEEESVSIHIGEEVTLPGTVMFSDTEATYRPHAAADIPSPISTTMVTVIVTEEGRARGREEGEEEGEGERGHEVGESSTSDSVLSSSDSVGSNGSTRSSDRLLKH